MLKLTVHKNLASCVSSIMKESERVRCQNLSIMKTSFHLKEGGTILVVQVKVKQVLEFLE